MPAKKRFTKVVAYNQESAELTKKLMDALGPVKLQEGSVVKGKVTDIIDSMVIVDIGMKNEGRINISEFSNPKYNAQLPKVGDTVDVLLERLESYSGGIVLSREKAIRQEIWEFLKKAYETGELVEGLIFTRVKGGFAVNLLGIEVFLPGSQVDIRPVKDYDALVNLVKKFKILSMGENGGRNGAGRNGEGRNGESGNIIISLRAVLEASREDLKNELLDQVKEGMVLEGIIKNIVDYGVFIDLGSLDGLLHITDISWKRIHHPSEAGLQIGDKINVQVIKFDKDNRRLHLGLKQLSPSPWSDIDETFTIGQIVTGRVINVNDNGAFVELKEGIEGTVSSFEISWSKSEQNAKKALTIGQDIQCVILEIDKTRCRISLSIKRCFENPWKKFADQYPVGSIINAPIRTVAEFGIFVALDNMIDGMIHESDLADKSKEGGITSRYKKDDMIQCIVTGIDLNKERVNLSTKISKEHGSTRSKDGSAQENV